MILPHDVPVTGSNVTCSRPLLVSSTIGHDESDVALTARIYARAAGNPQTPPGSIGSLGMRDHKSPEATQSPIPSTTRALRGQHASLPEEVQGSLPHRSTRGAQRRLRFPLKCARLREPEPGVLESLS